MQLSPDWNAAVLTSLRSITKLDLRDSRWPLTITLITFILERCHLSLVDLTIDNLMVTDVRSVVRLLRNLQDDPAEVALDFPKLRSLSILHPEAALRYLYAEVDFPSHAPHFKHFEQLTRLTLPVEEPRDIIESIMLADFPNLLELNLTLSYDATRRQSKITFFNDLVTSYRHPKLRVLNIGGSPFMDDYRYPFPYSARNERAKISLSLVLYLMRLCPELIEFRCTYMDIVNNNMFQHPLPIDHIIPRFLNFAALNPRLRLLDMRYSRSCAEIEIPPTCKMSILKMVGKIPHFCVTDYEDGVATEPLSQSDRKFQLEIFDISGYQEAHSQSIINALSRLNRRSLKILDISLCPDVDFDSRTSDTVEECETLLSNILFMFPKLETLSIGYNNRLHDGNLRSVGRLRHKYLRSLDISGSPNITENGIKALLDLESCINLQRLVLFNCPQLCLDNLRSLRSDVQILGEDSDHIVYELDGKQPVISNLVS
ncbi:uncharacterized protein V2V93DRAFT_145929 [Kockiozyma suomiensis]|uniref:uncharacterized protein n=1 Tax=Kockiozyma suomiensis TaxID=1337062 RepID=UPI003343D245